MRKVKTPKTKFASYVFICAECGTRATEAAPNYFRAANVVGDRGWSIRKTKIECPAHGDPNVRP